MKWLISAVIAVCVLMAVGFCWYVVATFRVISLTEPVVVVIPEGSGTEGAAKALADAGVIKSPVAFMAYATVSGQRSAIRADQYTFQGDLNMKLVMGVVTQKVSLQNEVEVTWLEGWTTQQMGEQLAKVLPFTAEDYVRAADAQQLNGYLFPDTYRFFTDATVQDVIDKQVAAFDAKFTDAIQQELERLGRTKKEAVILASIVEKEAATKEDKGLVAGVFWRRLDNGKRLESDATLNYITGKTSLEVPLSDTYLESAYNTYRNDGLPPGAIDNPGLDALTAAVYPTESDYWYFLATPDGEVKYSATYDQHLQYKAEYYPD